MQIFGICNRAVNGLEKLLWPQIAHCAGLQVAERAKPQIQLDICVCRERERERVCVCVRLIVCLKCA